MEEAELVTRAVAGEQMALNRLLLTHYGPLAARLDKRIPAQMRSLIAPEDILQEVFAEVFQTVAGFKPGSPDAFYKWLATIADHRLLDAVRAHRAAKRGGGRVA